MLYKHDLLFQEKDFELTLPDLAKTPQLCTSWKVLVVDDDHDIHLVTKLILKSLKFDGQALEFIDAYSGAEARNIIQQHPDIAIILLDVVMESDVEGLKVVKFIRDELKNPFVRIILRTGQPGIAPEMDVINQYDINDYMDKATLNNQRLITVLTTSIRSFNLLRTVENTRRGLKKIIEATSKLYEPKSLDQLATGILTQLVALISHDDVWQSRNAASCFAATKNHGTLNIYAAFGLYEPYIGQAIDAVIPSEVKILIEDALRLKSSQFTNQDFLVYFKSKNGIENLIYLKVHHPLELVDRNLIEVFTSNIASAFENLFLNSEIIKSQKDVTFTLGEIIESRSSEAGQHVKRVAESSYLLARLAGLSDEESEILRTASPMHDLGKIGIPDSILNKPGKLTKEEWIKMQSHTTIGCHILKSNDQTIIKAGGMICEQHHEKWDGSGYPIGLKREEIHIFARITAIIDVFDALTNKRVYKEAWSIEKTLDLFKKDCSSHFDPRLTELFLNNIDSFLEIQEEFDDAR
jgi:response regulator RpfG family c-di-GMP phosphodiesterase